MILNVNFIKGIVGTYNNYPECLNVLQTYTGTITNKKGHVMVGGQVKKPENVGINYI